jgi:acetyl esterase/lipase
VSARRWIVAGSALVVLATAAVTLALAGGDEQPRLRHLAVTVDYLPGVAADVFLPARTRPRTPVVVLVPGGSWRTADRTGLRPLADALAGAGMVAVTARYRAADDGVRFPVPVADVVCAVDFAAARAAADGVSRGPVIVLGHSAGAHLAALAALTGPRFRGSCPYPQVRIDGLVGLAGPYDIMSLQSVADPLFGASAAEDAPAWRAGNAVTWVRRRPELPALLVHGADDTVVSPTFTTTFAERLRAAGHPVQVDLVPGAGHGDIYHPDIVASRVIAWVDELR